MPKAPPDKVIIHRIEFQESERRLLEQVAMAYTVDKASESISQLTTLIVLVFGTSAVISKWDDLEAWYTKKRAEGQLGGMYGNQDPDVYDENAASVVGGIQNLINNILDTLFHPLRL
tara:strand:+ start:122 stop:472 length:351 start_codon:yes stop_codon:yes gene_type:complete